MTHDELSARTVLADLERQWERAAVDWIKAPTWESRSAAWERLNDLARLIRGHCVAYHLVPAVDVGELR